MSLSRLYRPWRPSPSPVVWPLRTIALLLEGDRNPCGLRGVPWQALSWRESLTIPPPPAPTQGTWYLTVIF